MDELEFRRQAYGEPKRQDPEFLNAINEAPGRETFIKELKSLDAKLNRALTIDVPSDLSEKLILRQQLHHHHHQKRKTGLLIAMAASIAFVAGISFSMWRLAPVDLAEHALAHVYHETRALAANESVSYQDVNFQLASLHNMTGARFTQQPGNVYFTAYCDFQGVRSLHLVMQGKLGKVTLFIVPLENRMVLEEAFADNQYQGIGFQTNSAFMLLVGEQQSDLADLKQEIKQTFI